MRNFITTEVKRRLIDKAWTQYMRECMKPPNEEDRARIVSLRRWIEDAIALADRGDDLPAFPKHGEDYDP